MQITLRHRELPDGSCYVDGRIEFSEEEKAIVVTRRIGNQYALNLPSAFPQGSGISPYGFGAGFLKFIGWTGIIIGVLSIPGMIAEFGRNQPVPGTIMLIFSLLCLSGGIGAFVARSRQQALHTASFSDQTISLGLLLANPVFTVHAPSRDSANSYAQEIRGQLRMIKDGIMRHAEQKATETYEI